MSVDAVRAAIRDVPDFPIKGIVFKDITPILSDAALFRMAVDLFIDRHRDHPPDKIAVIESRAFLFGSCAAYELGCGLVPVRKKGKLPADTLELSYDLEYGSATLEVHADAAGAGDRVVVMDDLLATGGTAAATVELLNKLGATVTGCDFLVELAFLNGRARLPGLDIFAPIVFD